MHRSNDVEVRRLFDYFIGARKQQWREREAERLGGLEIDNQLVLRRLLNREIGRLGALEDPFAFMASPPREIPGGRRAAPKTARPHTFPPPHPPLPSLPPLHRRP